MSRVLANILGAAEPEFRQQINRLEQAAGLPNADIRLMMQVIGTTRDKIRELGLDPHDTTGPELYAALKSRLQADETRLRMALKLDDTASAADILRTVSSQFARLKDDHAQTFAVKAPAMKALLKRLQPKATMKKLGYRSMDSMLKHEPVAQLLVAANAYESRDWLQRKSDAYRKLRTSDFETRRVSFTVPTGKQWPLIAEAYAIKNKHNVVTVPELGAIIMLPMDYDVPALAVTMVLLGTGSLNDMRSLGSYLKLQQVRPDYGEVFASAIASEPMTAAHLAGEPLPWKIVQWFYGHGHSAYHPEIFEPHIQPEDLSWLEGEDILAELNPALEFWQGGQLLALLDGNKPVSLNLLDVALSVSNSLEYGERVVRYMRESLGRELLAQYLHKGNLQAMLLGKLDEQLAPEPTFE